MIAKPKTQMLHHQTQAQTQAPIPIQAATVTPTVTVDQTPIQIKEIQLPAPMLT